MITARLATALQALHAMSKDWVIEAERHELMAATGTASVRSLRRALAELESEGMLSRSVRRGPGSRFRIELRPREAAKSDRYPEEKRPKVAATANEGEGGAGVQASASSQTHKQAAAADSVLGNTGQEKRPKVAATADPVSVVVNFGSAPELIATMSLVAELRYENAQLRELLTLQRGRVSPDKRHSEAPHQVRDLGGHPKPADALPGTGAECSGSGLARSEVFDGRLLARSVEPVPSGESDSFVASPDDEEAVQERFAQARDSGETVQKPTALRALVLKDLRDPVVRQTYKEAVAKRKKASEAAREAAEAKQRASEEQQRRKIETKKAEQEFMARPPVELPKFLRRGS